MQSALDMFMSMRYTNLRFIIIIIIIIIICGTVIMVIVFLCSVIRIITSNNVAVNQC